MFDVTYWYEFRFDCKSSNFARIRTRGFHSHQHENGPSSCRKSPYGNTPNVKNPKTITASNNNMKCARVCSCINNDPSCEKNWYSVNKVM